jgi:hypothetical protein
VVYRPIQDSIPALDLSALYRTDDRSPVLLHFLRVMRDCMVAGH